MRDRSKLVIISASVLSAGYLGLQPGLVLHPDANLLGGFALVFGPLYWLVQILLPISLVVWCILALRDRLAK